MKTSTRIWLVAAAVMGIGVLAWIGIMRTPQEQAQVAATPKAAAQPLKQERSADANYVMQGTAAKKTAAVQTAQKAAAKSHEKRDPFYYGSTPAVALDANPQVKSVVEAIQTKTHPERLSALIAPKPFDAKTFKTDLAAYLNVVEPARVFQVAQPGPGVPRLRSGSPTYRQILQGETTVLRVQAPAGFPVTFTSFDLGQFENQLTSMTVQANSAGLAEVKFIASSGTIEDVHILAGSPAAAGQVRFTVNVQMPAETAISNATGSTNTQNQLTKN